MYSIVTWSHRGYVWSGSKDQVEELLSLQRSEDTCDSLEQGETVASCCLIHWFVLLLVLDNQLDFVFHVNVDSIETIAVAFHALDDKLRKCLPCRTFRICCIAITSIFSSLASIRNSCPIKNSTCHVLSSFRGFPSADRQPGQSTPQSRVPGFRT